MASKRINVIGCGRAAGSLVRLWIQSQAINIGDILNRSPDSSKLAVMKAGGGHAATSLSEMEPADYWLIGASDDQILNVANEMAQTVSNLEGSLVFHLAGRYGLDVLSPLVESGACLAALHPVRSLTDASISIAEFAGTACVAEGSDESFELLEPLITEIEGTWLPVRAIDRGLYHASVSIVSNITKSIAWKAQKWQCNAGLPAETAASVTHQLLQSTMDDLTRLGAKNSITGPVVRGDTSTIAAHIDAITQSHPEDIDVYRVLARTVLELAQERGDLDEETLQKFRELFMN